MSWRVIVITNRCKLDLKLGYMVVRGAETRKVFLDEISVLIIENPAVSMTGVLLQALTEKKIKVIFCDSKHSPLAELTPYYGSYDCSRKLKLQLGWSEEIKGEIWADIVSEKINQQAEFLHDLGKEKEGNMLKSYIGQIEPFDVTNREGHAAKVYFNAVFGMDFTRDDNSIINSALDYGYSIILSAFNREIVANGCLTQLGLFHDNVFNQYNLSCDLMEPFRILIDRKVYDLDFTEFKSHEKYQLIETLNDYVSIDSTKQTMLNAIKIYTRSVIEALNTEDSERIKFMKII